MAKVLCAWEFGAGLGHLLQIIPVAERLVDEGHTVCLAVPDPHAALRLIKPVYVQNKAINVIAGPIWSVPSDIHINDIPMQTMADVLWAFDFHKSEKLGFMTDRWSQIIQQSQAELIVADAAPTLRLAAASSIPFVVVGNSGYTIPPLGRSLPPIRPWETDVCSTSKVHETEILNVVNQIRRLRDAAPFDYVADLFNGDESFICTFPYFDPYRAYRRAPPLRPYNVPVILKRQLIRERQKAPVFIYLPADHPSITTIFLALDKLNMPAEAYISNADAPRLHAAAPNNIKIMDAPARFEEVLGSCRMIIHHAGVSTAYAALQAGAPQILLPKTLEHLITAKKVLEIAGGFGKNVSSEKLTVEDIMNYVTGLTHPASWAKIEAAASQFVLPAGNSTLDWIVERTLALL